MTERNPEYAEIATVSDLNGNKLLSRVFYKEKDVVIKNLIDEAEALFGLQKEEIVIDVKSEHYRFAAGDK